MRCGLGNLCRRWGFAPRQVSVNVAREEALRWRLRSSLPPFKLVAEEPQNSLSSWSADGSPFVGPRVGADAGPQRTQADPWADSRRVMSIPEAEIRAAVLSINARANAAHAAQGRDIARD